MSTTPHEYPLRAIPGCPLCDGDGYFGPFPCRCPGEINWAFAGVEAGARLALEEVLNESNPFRGKKGERLWLVARQLELMGEPHNYPSDFHGPEHGKAHHKGDVLKDFVDVVVPRVHRDPVLVGRRTKTRRRILG